MKRGLSAAEQQALATGRYSQLDAKDEEVTEVLPSKVPDEAAAVVDTNKQEQTKQRAKRDALATGEDKARFEKECEEAGIEIKKAEPKAEKKVKEKKVRGSVRGRLGSAGVAAALAWPSMRNSTQSK